MVTRHTPGPWEAIPHSANSGAYYVRSTINREVVAACLSPADARLIAAAPELLDILRIVNKAFQRSGDFQLGPKGRHAGLDAAVAALLTRIEGKD